MGGGQSSARRVQLPLNYYSFDRTFAASDMEIAAAINPLLGVVARFEVRVKVPQTRSVDRRAREAHTGAALVWLQGPTESPGVAGG